MRHPTGLRKRCIKLAQVKSPNDGSWHRGDHSTHFTRHPLTSRMHPVFRSVIMSKSLSQFRFWAPQLSPTSFQTPGRGFFSRPIFCVVCWDEAATCPNLCKGIFPKQEDASKRDVTFTYSHTARHPLNL